MWVMHNISRDHIVYSLDRQHAPVLAIDPGERIVLETWDARSGTINSDADLLLRPHPVGSNPATGPIHVRGAEPGDALAVHIEAIDLAPSGFLAVKKGEGLLAARAEAHDGADAPGTCSALVMASGWPAATPLRSA